MLLIGHERTVSATTAYGPFRIRCVHDFDGSTPVNARWCEISGLRTNRRRLDGETAGAPHEIQFEVDLLSRAIGIGLGAHPNHAVAQSPLQRSQILPFQPVERIARGMRLRQRGAGGGQSRSWADNARPSRLPSCQSSRTAAHRSPSSRQGLGRDFPGFRGNEKIDDLRIEGLT